MQLERKNYSELGTPLGPYVHAVKCNGLLFISGMTASGSTAHGGSVAAQAEVILERITTIARNENIDLRALVKVTIFVTEMQDIAALRSVLAKCYGEHKPASSLVQVSRLVSPDLSIEIEATLMLKE